MLIKSASVAPDGGWGWVVAFASAFIYFLAFGITAIGGLLMLGVTSQIFQDSRHKAIWVPVLCNGMSRLFAPIAIYFSNKYSYRAVMIAGSILMTLGFALSFSASSFDLLFGYFGIIVGIGASFCVYPSAILTTLYFDKHASLANGIYTAGQAFGCIIFPICVDPLFNLVGIRSTFLYLGGIGLQICVAAALCQPVEWHLKTRKSNDLQLELSKEVIIPSNKSEDEEQTREDFFSFFKNRDFYFLTLSCTAPYLSMATYPIIIPEFALEAIPDTHSFDRTAYLLSAGAIADFLARSTLGWVFDLSFVNRTFCYYAINVIFGLTILLTGFLPNYLSMMMVCIITGICTGIWSIVAAVTYKEHLGVNAFGPALTVSAMVSGILAILIGSVVGPFRALTGSYNIMFLIIGGYQMAGPIIWFLSRLCCK